MLLKVFEHLPRNHENHAVENSSFLNFKLAARHSKAKRFNSFILNSTKQGNNYTFTAKVWENK